MAISRLTRNQQRIRTLLPLASAGILVGSAALTDFSNRHWTKDFPLPVIPTSAMAMTAAGLGIKAFEKLRNRSGIVSQTLSNSFLGIGVTSLVGSHEYTRNMMAGMWDSLLHSMDTAAGRFYAGVAGYGAVGTASSLLRNVYYRLRNVSVINASESMNPRLARIYDSNFIKNLEILGFAAIPAGLLGIYSQSAVGYETLSYFIDSVGKPFREIGASTLGTIGAFTSGLSYFSRNVLNSRLLSGLFAHTGTSVLGGRARRALGTLSLAGAGLALSQTGLGQDIIRGGLETLRSMGCGENPKLTVASYLTLLTGLSFLSIGEKQSNANGLFYRISTFGKRMFPIMLGVDTIALSIALCQNNLQFSSIFLEDGKHINSFISALAAGSLAALIASKISSADAARLTMGRGVPSKDANRIMNTATKTAMASQALYLGTVTAFTFGFMFYAGISAAFGSQHKMGILESFLPNMILASTAVLSILGRLQDLHQTGSALGAQEDINRNLYRENNLHLTDQEIQKDGEGPHSPHVLISNALVNPADGYLGAFMNFMYGLTANSVMLTQAELRPTREEDFDRIRITKQNEDARIEQRNDLVHQPLQASYDDFMAWLSNFQPDAQGNYNIPQSTYPQLEQQYRNLINAYYRQFETLYPYFDSGNGRTIIEQYYRMNGRRLISQPAGNFGRMWAWISDQDYFRRTAYDTTNPDRDANYIANMKYIAFLHSSSQLRKIQELELSLANPDYVLSIKELYDAYLESLYLTSTRASTEYRRFDLFQDYLPKPSKTQNTTSRQLSVYKANPLVIGRSIMGDFPYTVPAESPEMPITSPFYMFTYPNWHAGMTNPVQLTLPNWNPANNNPVQSILI